MPRRGRPTHKLFDKGELGGSIACGYLCNLVSLGIDECNDGYVVELIDKAANVKADLADATADGLQKVGERELVRIDLGELHAGQRRGKRRAGVVLKGIVTH